MTFLCGGCNVREPWEHRCHRSDCSCEDCAGRPCGCVECSEHAFVEWLSAVMRDKFPDLSEDEVRRLAEATASNVDDRASFLRAYEASTA